MNEIDLPGNPLIPNPRLKRRYDKRVNNGKHLILPNHGPIPKEVKDLSRQQARRALKAFDAIANVAAIYQYAWKKGNLTALLQMRDSAENRAYGKPFVCNNPEESGRPRDENVQRMAVAIQNLQIVNGVAIPGKRTRRRKVLDSGLQLPEKTIVSSSDQTIEAGAKPVGDG